ncbi:hypothetical protein ACFODL_13420 [Phenylobacterium terrae]|uniref:DUF2306 domain-containing protein n=1 Tax=Phenylobacterium terrae TaxID=2665495 RepID=A0ABW4N1D7_9CAUL
MPYPAPVMLHVLAGLVAIGAGFAALAVRKGGPSHRQIGTVFFVAMLLMAGSAAVMAAIGGQRLNTIAGLFTLYLVSTAWLAVRRPPRTTGRFETWAMAGAALVCLAGLAIGLQAATVGVQDGDPSSGNDPTIYFVFAGLAALGVGTDLRVMGAGGLAGRPRLARHLWRMCLALFVAAGSFFFGQADEIPQAFRGPHLMIPPLAALGALAFWMIRVRFPARFVLRAPAA